MATVKVTLTNFDKEILNAKKPAILDFWATWCGPCQWMGPVFDEEADRIVGFVPKEELEAKLKELIP